MKNEHYSIGYLFVLFFIFLAVMNFFNLANFLWVGAFICCFLFLKKYKTTPIFIVYILLAIAILLFGEKTILSLNAVLSPFLFPIAFFIGYIILDFFKEKKVNSSEKTVYKIFYLLTIAIFIHIFLNLRTNTNLVDNRNTIDYWTQQTLSATNQITLFCVPIAVCLAVIFFNKNFFMKLFSLGMIAVMFIYNLTLATRTFFVFLLIGCLILILYLFFSKAIIHKTKINFLCGLAIIILLVIISLQMNLFNLNELILNSNLYNRLFGKYKIGLLEDSRLDLKLQYLEIAVMYPLGNNDIYRIVGNYAHDILLDTYSGYSVFAFIFVIIILVNSLINLFVFLKNENYSFYLKSIFLIVFTLLMFEFFMEPIIQGVPHLLVIFSFISGLLCYINKNNIERKI